MSVIRNLIETVLKESNIKKEELKGTEIVGGGWRVTKVQQLIESLVKVIFSVHKFYWSVYYTSWLHNRLSMMFRDSFVFCSTD